MTFVSGFFSFTVDVANADSGFHGRVRFKIPRHPEESDSDFYGRVLAYLIAYEPQLEFSRGPFAPEEPTLWHRDSIGQIRRWIQVGELQHKKLRGALNTASRTMSATRFQVFFTDSSHVTNFAEALKGSKSNWIHGVEFFLLDPAFLELIATAQESSARWNMTIVDASLYLSINRDNAVWMEATNEIRSVSPWEEYQRIIGNEPHSGKSTA